MSFPLETLIIVAVIMLVIGGIIGLVVSKTWIPPTQQRSLEDKLHNTQKELEKYQQDVAKHFMDTAQKVTDLTDSYRSLHDHLSKGAMNLASSEISKELIAAASIQKRLTTEEAESDPAEPVEPPKDWAPRSGAIGTLSEDYGLDEAKQDPSHKATSPPKV